MRAQATGAIAGENSGHRRELDEVDRRNCAVAGIRDVSEKMQVGTQERRTEFQRDFANGQGSKNYEQKNEAKIEAQFQLIVRPRTAAIWRASPISCSSSAGRMDCGPSERAWSGSWWTSTSNPSAPTAMAGARERQHFVAPPGAVRGIHDDRKMAALLHGGNDAQVQRVASEIRKSADAALAEDYGVVAFGHQVFARHQEFVERGGHAALQQDGFFWRARHA